MAYTKERFYEIFEEGFSNKDISFDRYMTWCFWLVETEGMIGDEYFKSLLIKERENILKVDKDMILWFIKTERKREKSPKTHYWLWLDKL